MVAGIIRENYLISCLVAFVVLVLVVVVLVNVVALLQLPPLQRL